MFTQKNVIAEIFVRNFFGEGHNLFAIVWQEKDCFGVQCGNKTKIYKRRVTALKKYNEYLDISIQILEKPW